MGSLYWLSLLLPVVATTEATVTHAKIRIIGSSTSANLQNALFGEPALMISFRRAER